MTKDQAEQIATAIEVLITTALLRDKLKNNASTEAQDRAHAALVALLERI
jgi:hypothetical protein